MAKTLFKWDYSDYPGAKNYLHLFKPIEIGNLFVPNRIKYAATEENLNGLDGFITDSGVAYMRERAKGVVGSLCFMQGVYMDEARKGQGYVGQAAAWDDKFIPGLKRIADVGENVVVWGNRKPGIGCALHLAKQGKKVTLVGKDKTAGFDVNPSFYRWRQVAVEFAGDGAKPLDVALRAAEVFGKDIGKSVLFKNRKNSINNQYAFENIQSFQNRG